MKDTPTRPRRRPFSGPTTALLWEQWRLLLPFLAGLAFMAAAGTLGLYINMVNQMIARGDAQVLSDFVRRLCSIILPGLCCANFTGGVAFPHRLYRLPVSTRRMVLYVAVPRLLFLLSTLAVLLGFRVLLLGAPDWDAELRMTVLSVCALAAGMGLSWMLAGRGRDWPAVLAQFVVILLAWMLFDVLGKAGVRAVLGPDILWPLAGLWVLFWTLAVFAGPGRARSGVSLLRRLPRGGHSAAAVRAVPRGPLRRRRFSSPLEAQLWYERRTRGYAGLLYPLVFAILATLVIADSIFLGPLGFVPVYGLTVGTALLSAALCFLVAAGRGLVEAHRVRAGRFRFLAAKPISTQDLARARFYGMCRNVEKALLFAFACAVFVWLLPPKPLLLTPSLWPLWLAEAHQSLDRSALIWLFAWTVLLWLCVTLTAYSTPKVLAVLFVLPLLELGTTYAPIRGVMHAGGDEIVIALTGLLLLAHVAAMHVRAWRRGLLSPVTVLLCLSVCAVVAQLLVPHLTGLSLWEGPWYTARARMACTIELFGILALVAAPVAALPLQFDRWRHGGR